MTDLLGLSDTFVGRFRLQVCAVDNSFFEAASGITPGKEIGPLLLMRSGPVVVCS
jgi:hypothetical protein